MTLADIPVHTLMPRFVRLTFRSPITNAAVGLVVVGSAVVGEFDGLDDVGDAVGLSDGVDVGAVVVGAAVVVGPRVVGTFVGLGVFLLVGDLAILSFPPR